MGLLHRSGVCVLALVAGAAARQFEPTVVRDLAFERDGQRFSVGAVKVPLWSAAFPQSASSFTLENVRFSFKGATYEMRSVEVSGATSSRAEIEALFSPTSTESMASRIGRISAKKVTIPEIKTTQQFAKQTQTTLYREIVLADITEGRIGSATAASSAAEATGEMSAVFTSGRRTVNDLDMKAMASLYETKAEDTSVPMTRIYGAFSIENFEFTESKEGINVKVARLGGRDAMGRPTKDSWAGSIAFLTELGDKEKPGKDDNARILSVLTDMATAGDFGFVEATGIEVKTSPAKGKDASDASGRIARIAYTGTVGSQAAEVRVEGFDVGNKDGRFKIDALSLTGFSFMPTLEGLKTLQSKEKVEFDQATMRSLIPTLGTLRISGVDADVPSEAKQGRKAERQKLSVKNFEITADKPINGIPTNVRIDLQNLAMALPPTSDEEGIRDLIALGYKNLDLSFLVSAVWNRETEELSIREYSLRGQDMGSLSVTGVLGNVTKDVFDPDTAVAAVALVGAKAKALDITVENKGLFERYLANEAKEQKTKPEALRATYGTAAALALPSIIGTSEQAKAISQAVARFIAKPGRLTINAKAKDPSGLSLSDIIALPEPADAFAKMNVTAKAE